MALLTFGLLLVDRHSAGAATSGEVITQPPAPDALSPANPPAESGWTRLYIGYSATPRVNTFSFLQADGLGFDVAWSTREGFRSAHHHADGVGRLDESNNVRGWGSGMRPRRPRDSGDWWGTWTARGMGDQRRR